MCVCVCVDGCVDGWVDGWVRGRGSVFVRVAVSLVNAR